MVVVVVSPLVVVVRMSSVDISANAHRQRMPEVSLVSTVAEAGSVASGS
jgi:hypothetical protein